MVERISKFNAKIKGNKIYSVLPKHKALGGTSLLLLIAQNQAGEKSLLLPLTDIKKSKECILGNTGGD
jgi:hypothetical protein